MRIIRKGHTQACDAVTIKLIKEANNKAFGANTQRIRNRTKVIPVVDNTNELERVSENATFAVSVGSIDDRVNTIHHDYEDSIAFLDMWQPFSHAQLQMLMCHRDAQLQRLNERGDFYERVAKTWKGTADEKLYQTYEPGKHGHFKYVRRPNLCNTL